MFKKSFKGKIIFPAILVVTVLVVVLSVYSSVKFLSYSDAVLTEEMESSINNLKDRLNNMQSETKAAAETVASDIRVIDAIGNRKTDELLRLLIPVADMSGADYFTITDGEGIVLARTYEPDNFGDSVANQHNVQRALKGNTETYFESGTSIRVAMRTGAPVYDGNGTIIGVISAGIRFDVDSFVDELRDIYGTEATVFQGRIRVSTTIAENGRRAVDSQLDPEIANIVLESKQEYFGEASILGIRHKTFYLPLLNADNEAFAIISVARSQMDMLAAANAFIFESILIGAVGLIAAILLLLFITTKISRPIVGLSKDMDNVADGNLSVNTDINSQDETGRFNKSIHRVVDTIREMIDDINVMRFGCGLSTRQNVSPDMSSPKCLYISFSFITRYRIRRRFCQSPMLTPDSSS
ncbi:MAG: cache domain-containing protein [Clostridiales bacterium]|nr:cache domain-containing protein [Clostridiales bacterium]